MENFLECNEKICYIGDMNMKVPLHCLENASFKAYLLNMIIAGEGCAYEQVFFNFYPKNHCQKLSFFELYGSIL